MGHGFNMETLGLNISQQWAWDAALKTVKVKVVLQILSPVVNLQFMEQDDAPREGLLVYLVNPSARMHSEGYSSSSVCVCVCLCVRFLYSAFSHILVSNER